MAYYRHELSGPINAGDVWTTTLHTTGSVDIAAAHAAWSTCASSIANAIKTYWPTATSTNGVKTFLLDDVTGKNKAVQQGNLVVAGAVATSQGPPATALTVGLRTTLPTRAGRGRMYLPGLSNTNLDAKGLWLPATITALTPLIAAAFKTLSLTFQVVVYHRKPPVTGGANPAPFGTSVTSITIGVIPNVQRRRTNKVPQSYTTAAAV